MPQPLPHILAVAEHQQRVQRTRNVNMPHPTPPTDPRGRSINLVPKPWKMLRNGERHTAVYAACANYMEMNVTPRAQPLLVHVGL